MSTQTQPILLRRVPNAGVVPAVSEFNLNSLVIDNFNGLLYWLDNNGLVQSIPILPGNASAEGTIASAATTDLGSKPTAYIAISGTTAITSFGSKPKQAKFVRFTGSLTLTQNATSLNLPGRANITTVAGDTCLAISDSNGNWNVYWYQKADGTPLIGSATGSLRYDIAQSLTQAQRNQAKKNSGTRTAQLSGISSGGSMVASQINEVMYFFTGNYTVNIPPVASWLNGDVIEFTNLSQNPVVLSRASGDSCNFYYDKGVVTSTYTLQAGASCAIVCSGNDFAVFNNSASRTGSVALDYTQAVTSAQMAQLITNLGLAPVALVYAATYTADLSTFFNATMTLTGNITFANPSNMRPGQAGEIVLTQDGTGSRTIAFGSYWKFIGGAPTATTTAGAVDVISYRVISSTLIVCGFGKGVA